MNRSPFLDQFGDALERAIARAPRAAGSPSVPGRMFLGGTLVATAAISLLAYWLATPADPQAVFSGQASNPGAVTLDTSAAQAANPGVVALDTSAAQAANPGGATLNPSTAQAANALLPPPATTGLLQLAPASIPGSTPRALSNGIADASTHALALQAQRLAPSPAASSMAQMSFGAPLLSAAGIPLELSPESALADPLGPSSPEPVLFVGRVAAAVRAVASPADPESAAVDAQPGELFIVEIVTPIVGALPRIVLLTAAPAPPSTMAQARLRSPAPADPEVTPAIGSTYLFAARLDIAQNWLVLLADEPDGMPAVWRISGDPNLTLEQLRALVAADEQLRVLLERYTAP